MNKNINTYLLIAILVLTGVNTISALTGPKLPKPAKSETSMNSDIPNQPANNPPVISSNNPGTTPNQPTADPFKQPEPAPPSGPTTSISFAEQVFDFGTINQGDKVEHTFKFTNTGNEPLIISDAKGSCGCTVPEWPKQPIAPGATGEMVVHFDSKGKSGSQTTAVTITANTNPPTQQIQVKSNVVGGTTPANNGLGGM